MSDDESTRVVVAVFAERQPAERALEKAAELGAEEGVLLHRDGEGRLRQSEAVLSDIGRGAAAGAGLGAVGGAVAAASLPGAGVAIGLASTLTGAAVGSLFGSSLAVVADEVADRSVFRPAFDRIAMNEWAAAAKLPGAGADLLETSLVGDLRHWSYGESPTERGGTPTGNEPRRDDRSSRP